MSFLSKLFGYVSAEERKGISLANESCWEISTVKRLSTFLRALLIMVPLDSVLYIESCGTPKRIRLYLEERIAKNRCKVEMGTIWPRAECFHMQITKENLEGLAELSENYVEPQIACHIHVYKDGKMLLQWYDAFFDPFFVSKQVSEDSIRQFCEKVGAEYKECEMC